MKWNTEMHVFKFFVPIEPTGKALRVVRFHNHGSIRPTEASEKSMATIRDYARAYMLENSLSRLTGNIVMRIDAFFRIPRRLSKAHRAEALMGIKRPTKKPDYDNIAKGVGDAVNDWCFNDDAKIVDGRVLKW